MKTSPAFIVTWMAAAHVGVALTTAQAQPSVQGQRDQVHQQRHKAQPTPKRSGHTAKQGSQMPGREGVTAHGADVGAVPIGGYFQDPHRRAAREYYDRPENQGFCPPGLAKKGTGCLPPGQAKAWRRGAPLPAGVVYYDVPRSVVLTLGVPPQGYKYVRVASDILLMAVGTRMVIDAIEDLVR